MQCVGDRPLLSPEVYRDLVLASYAPIIAAARRSGVETIVLATYGNTACGPMCLLRVHLLSPHARAADYQWPHPQG